MLSHPRLKRLAIESLESRHLLAVWAPQGPAPILEGQVENVLPNNDVAGAVHALAAHPTNADILYAGAVNGGVWKTTNATSPSPNWTPLTDDLPTLSIGALEFDPTDASGQSLIAGLGSFSSFGAFRGIVTGGPLTGIIRTTDGGDTWAQLGQTDLVDVNVSGVASRADTILVAGNDTFGAGREGMYRSNDGGVSFQLISGSNGLATGPVTDLVGDPSDPSRLYAAVIPTFNDTTGVRESSGGIFRTDDLGGTWTDVSGAATASINAPANVHPSSFNCGGVIPFYAGVNNVEMAVHNNAGGGTNAVYVAVMFQGQASAFFRSDEGVDGTDNDGDGVTDEPDETNFVSMDFPETNEGGTLVGLQPRSKPGAQGAIHFSIVADPTNPNVVYAGGDSQPTDPGPDGIFGTFDDIFPNSIGANDFTGRLFRGDASQAIGSQWVHLTHSNTMGAVGGGTGTGSAPHADSREMVFDANGELIEADDGGVYRRTSPPDNNGDWFSMNGSLQVTEFHNIAYDSNANIIIGGAQDTGTSYQIAAGSTTWKTVSTADGGDVAIDETSIPGSSIRYSSSQFLFDFRRQVFDANNTGGSQTFPARSGLLVFNDPACELQFTTPVELNAVDPSRLVVGGVRFVSESFDQGENFTDVNGSFGVTANTMVYGGYRGGVPNPAVLYAGGALFDAFGAPVSASNVFVRTTAAEPLALTATPFPGGVVRDIVLDPDDWMSAFVIDDGNQIFQTTDAGGSWSDITGNLPSLGADNFRSLQYIPGPVVDGVVLGTGSGVFATLTDDLGNWTKFGTTLPNAPVYDLDYDATDDVLVAGTLGRGAWLAANASLLLSNTPPIAADDGYATDEDVTLTVSLVRGVLANDTDPDGDPLRAILVNGPGNGSLALGDDGSFVYTPNFSFSGVDTFTYVASDNIIESNIATVTITVRAVNDPPIARGDIATTDIETPVVINVLANDTDPDSPIDLSSIVIVVSPANGSTVVNADGTVTYRPSAGFAGADAFRYIVRDTLGLASNVATVAIRVGPPVTLSGYAFIDFDDDLMREFDDGDLPIEGVTVRLQQTDGPFAMVLTTRTDANGFYQFTEQAGVNLLPGGIYRVSEIHPAILVDGRESVGTGFANSQADPVIVGNDVFSNIVLDPGAVASEFNFGELGLRVEFVLDFLRGRVFLASSGPDGITIGGGVLSSIDLTQGDVLVSFDVGWEGTMTASAQTSDASGEVVLTLYDENARTLYSTDSFGGVAELTAEATLGEARFLRLSGNHSDVSLILLGGVSDSTAPEARLHSMANVIAGGATNGRLTITFEDDVAVDFASIDDRDVRILGPNGYSTLATANLSIGAASGQTLTVDYTFTPPGGFWNAADSGAYRIEIEPNQVADISGNAVATRVLGSFTVDIDPTVPVAIDSLYSAVEDTQLSISAESGLLSHLDLSEPFAALPVTDPEHGILVLDRNGAFTYSPSPNFFGIDTFTYQITNGLRVGNTATVTLQVSNTNDAPRAFDDAFEAVTGEILDVGLERLVASGDLWRFLDDGSNQGTTWQSPHFDDGLWSEGRSQLGWGDGDEATTVSFGDDEENKHVTTYFRRTFEVADEAGVDALYLHLIRDDGAAVYLNGVEIARDNLAENAAYDTFANEKTRREAEQIFHVYAVDPSLLVEGENLLAVEVHQWRPGSSDMSMDARLTAVREPFVGTLTNDEDIDGDILEGQITSGPSNGLLTFNPNGTFVYVPEADFIGTDSFRYLASDGQSQSNESVVTINVRPQSTGPPADLTGDGFVDFDDLTLLLAHWDQMVSAGQGNLVDPLTTPINFQDLTLLLAAWTGPGPVGAPQAAVTESPLPSSDEYASDSAPTRRTPSAAQRRIARRPLSQRDLSPLRRLQAVDRAMADYQAERDLISARRTRRGR